MRFNKTSQYYYCIYRCKHYRATNSERATSFDRKGCPATLHLVKTTFQSAIDTFTESCAFSYVKKGGPHSDKCIDSTAPFLTSITLDCRGAMSKRVEELCLHDFKLTAQDIANQVMSEFTTTNKGKAFDFVSKEKMKSLVYYFRQREYGEWESRITSAIISSVSESDNRPFLQFKLDIPIDAKLEKVG